MAISCVFMWNILFLTFNYSKIITESNLYRPKIHIHCSLLVLSSIFLQQYQNMKSHWHFFTIKNCTPLPLPLPLFPCFCICLFFGQFQYSGSTCPAHLRCCLTSWLPGWPCPYSRPFLLGALLDCSGCLAPPLQYNATVSVPDSSGPERYVPLKILQPPITIHTVTDYISTVNDVLHVPDNSLLP